MHRCSTTILWIAAVCISLFIFPCSFSSVVSFVGFFGFVLVLFLFYLTFPLDLGHQQALQCFLKYFVANLNKLTKALQFKMVQRVAGSTCTAVQYTIICRHYWHWQTVHHLHDSGSYFCCKQNSTWLLESKGLISTQ